MKSVPHAHARSMLRGHAEFWRHAQTVALATTIPEIKLAIASACHALLHAYFLFLFSRPTGPSHRPSLSIFFDFHVFRISRPRFPLEIPGRYSGYSHWGSARDGPSSARACPPSRPSPPIFMFRGGPRHPFSRVRSIYETRFFSHNFFGRPSGFVESDTTASRNFEFRAVVVSDSTKPDGHRARFVVLLVSTKRV